MERKVVPLRVKLQNMSFMRKPEAHQLDSIITFLDKWMKENMLQEARPEDCIYQIKISVYFRLELWKHYEDSKQVSLQT